MPSLSMIDFLVFSRWIRHSGARPGYIYAGHGKGNKARINYEKPPPLQKKVPVYAVTVGGAAENGLKKSGSASSSSRTCQGTKLLVSPHLSPRKMYEDSKVEEREGGAIRRIGSTHNI